MGLRPPDGGTVEMYGQDVQTLAAADRSSLVRSYGVTFQNGALISSLTVAQNIQLPLREYYPASEKTLDELADLNLALVGLAPDAGSKISRRNCPAAWSSAPRWRGRLRWSPSSCSSTSRPPASIPFPPRPSMSYCCTFIPSCGSRWS